MKYIKSKIDNKTYCTINGKFKIHLKNHNLTYQEYYEKYVTGKKEYCICGKPKNFDSHGSQFNHKYNQTCGSKSCVDKLLSEIKSNIPEEKNKEINEKRKQTVLKKYGVEYVSLLDDVKEKAKVSNEKIIKDGKTSKEIQQEKARQTKLEKYGNSFYNNSDGISKGWKNISEDKLLEMKEKRKNTMLDRHGVENFLLHPTIISKINKTNAQFKEYILPSGTKIYTQGYEHLALDELFKTYSEDEIIISNPLNRNNTPVFEYVNVHRNKNKYYPDIFIPKENKVIEIKSTWWFNGYGEDKYKGRHENNLRKMRCVLSDGYDFEFWIYNNKSRTLEKSILDKSILME